VVARYCRVVLVAEGLNKDALAEARQLEDRLGLTPKSMRMLLWEIVADEVGQRREAASGARGRIRAVG
jgi:predicted ArsR family transcriptional regulator